MPSWERFVATDTIGMPAMFAANLVTSMVRPPPMPATASYDPARSVLPRLTALSTVASVTRKSSASPMSSRAATPSPCSPGPTASATRPSVAILRSASSAARSAIAPRRTSTASGTGSNRARSGMSLLPRRTRLPGRPAADSGGWPGQARPVCRALPCAPPARLAAGSDLPGPAQIGVVVDLHPVDRRPDRRRGDLPATVGQLLIAVLVVQAGVAPPGDLQRVGERPGGAGLDQGGPDVLT